MKSEDNVSDEFTRQSPGLEGTLSQHLFNLLWKKWGLSSGTLWHLLLQLKKISSRQKTVIFSRYFEETTKGADLFAQNLAWVENAYCFPPKPMIGIVLNFLKEQKKDCVLILPSSNATWVNLVSAHMIDLVEISKPFQQTQFSVLNQSGKRIP